MTKHLHLSPVEQGRQARLGDEFQEAMKRAEEKQKPPEPDKPQDKSAKLAP